MSTITFNIRRGLSREEQDRLLAVVAELPGVEHVSRIAPDIPDPFASRMCYATVGAEQEAQVCGRLSSMPNIEFASRPAERFAL